MRLRNRYLAAVLALSLAAGASAAVKPPVDLSSAWNDAQGTMGQARLPVLHVEYTPASHAYDAASAAVFQVIAAFRTADIPDNELDPDFTKFSPAQKARLNQLKALAQMDPIRAALALKEFLKNPSLPRISRDYLPPYRAMGSGSGFFISVADAEGTPHTLAVTNAHVAKMVAEIKAKTGKDAVLFIKSTQDPSPGQVGPNDIQVRVAAVGKNQRDIAFLEVPKGDWAVLPLADVSEANVADPVKVTNVVYALGFPLGSNFTVTEGIVSADTKLANNRIRNPYVHLIQTSAAINPGNSGGPLVRLVDNSFEVIGMNTLILSKSGGSAGVGYAISSNDILKAAQQYLNTGNLDVGFIGMQMRAQNFQGRMLVVVAGTIPGSPAEAGGLQEGDIVLSVDGEKLSADGRYAMVQIQEKAKAKLPGDKISLVVLRGTQSQTITITVGKEPDEVAAPHEDDDN